MTTQSLIGSLLALTGGEAVNAETLAQISEISKKNKFELLNSYDVSDIIYELGSFPSYFRTSSNEITVEFSSTSIYEIKSIFFDSLNTSDKKLIYKLICDL